MLGETPVEASAFLVAGFVVSDSWLLFSRIITFKMLSKLSTWKKVTIIFFVLIAGLAAIYFLGTESYRQSQKEERAVYAVAQTFVMDILKAPSTAEFQEFDRSKMIVGTDENKKIYHASAYVDSENSYGAMIRSDWEVGMEYQGGDMSDPSNWELSWLMFDGEVVY